MPARGSFDATKLANHLSISVDRSCSTLCKGSLWPFFALRTARRHLLSASNHGHIGVPKGKPMVGTPQWAAMSTESGGLCLDRVPLVTPNPSSIVPLCTLWGSPNSIVQEYLGTWVHKVTLLWWQGLVTFISFGIFFENHGFA